MKIAKEIIKTLPTKVKVPKVTKPKVTKIETPQVLNTIDNTAKAVSILSFILTYFATIKFYLVKYILTPLITLYLALINNPIYVIFKLFTKLYFIVYLITLILATYFLGIDQLTHNLTFMEVQNGFLIYVKDKLSSIFKWIMENLFGYKPVLFNKYSELEFIDRLADELNNEISDNHWYDFIKSPWFYIPVITLGIGCLFYSNLDAISNWFSGGNNPGPDSGGTSTVVRGSPDVTTTIPGPVTRATLNPTDVSNNVTRNTNSNINFPISTNQNLVEYLRERRFSNYLFNFNNTELAVRDFRAPSPVESTSSIETIRPSKIKTD